MLYTLNLYSVNVWYLNKSRKNKIKKIQVNVDLKSIMLDSQWVLFFQFEKA